MIQENHRKQRRQAQAGFTVTELIIASAAFVVILTAAMSMMVQWQRLTGSSESDIQALNDAAKAIGQIAEDVRTSTYLYHYATVSINFNNVTDQYTGQPLYSGAQTVTLNFPIVTQNATADGVSGNANPQAFFTNRGVDTSMMGSLTSSGSMDSLAMISDQPNGLTQPRYIIYLLGNSFSTLRAKTGRTTGNLSLCPLYRLEASPSVSNVDLTPNSWYTFRDIVSTSPATSGIRLTLTDRTTCTIQANWGGAPAAANFRYKFTKVANVVTGPGISGLFTLRNPHPYSNLELISPYLATVSLHTSRVPAGGGVRAGNVDVYTLGTSAFARNVPLPQL